MKKILLVLMAIALFLLPIGFRLAWTNVIPFQYEPQVITPDFTQATIPEPPAASASLEPVSSGIAAGQVVLIDYYHANQFLVNEVEPFTRALTSRGAITEIYNGENALEYHLKYASAYVVFSPLETFRQYEILAIERFVRNGGRLLVFTDPTRGLSFFDYTSPDIDSANLLLSAHGISFSGDYLYNMNDNEGNFRNVKFASFGEHPITEGLGTVILYGSHAVTSGNGTALLKAPSGTLSSLTDRGGDLVGMVISADGNVLAGGDFTFMTTPFFSVGDNALLVDRVAEFALGGQRQPSLDNFPHLFKGNVSLVPLGNTELTSSLLYQLAEMQTIFKLVNTNIELGTVSGPGNNLLIGTYEEDQEILAILEKYEITIDETRQFANIPGVGDIGLTGTGVMLFEPGSQGNTLILLADTSENLGALLSMFYNGYLYGCVLQDNLGICALGELGSYENGQEGEYYEEEYFEEEPEPSPTPAG